MTVSAEEASEVTRGEWLGIHAAITALPTEVAEAALCRIRETRSATRPVTCPLLDLTSGACLIYEARPIACRTYGFYVEREKVLGCKRIEALALDAADVVWGNHETLDEKLTVFGDKHCLSEWLQITVDC